MAVQSEVTNLDYFFHSSPDPMTIATLDGVLVDANYAWKDILDFEPDEIRGRSVFDFIHPEDVPRFGVQRQKMATSELGEVRVEFRGRHRDGTYSWLESHAVRGGDLIYAIHRDIDIRKRNELAATESLRMTRAILEAAADSIVVIDRNLIVVDVSPGTERVYGLTPEQCIGLNVLGVVHNQDQPSITLAIESLFTGESEEVKMARFRAIRGDGRWITIESRARLLIDADGSSDRAVLVSRDVTEAEAAQLALAGAKAEAEQANLAKSEFLSRMSHELRTPLNSVLGFAQLLQMEADSKTGHEAVDYIYTSGRHLLNLIDEILDISRVESGTLVIELEPLDVDELVKESIALFSLQATALGVTILNEACTGVLAMADGQRLKQVLINLLSNAIKFNHPEGTVIIHCTESSGRVRISITDSGPGIAPENRERLFAPFDRLDAESRGIEGTGLGLALSKGLVEAIGGSLDFESTLGVGSSFWVELPSAEGAVKPPRDVELTRLAATNSSEATVL
ncbi:MAG: PAS domain S-box protein, partial [Acidimicrobiales bacterium]